MKYQLTLVIHIIIIAIDLICGVYGNMVAHRSKFHSCLCEFPPGSSSILPLPKNILEDELVKITLGCACVFCNTPCYIQGVFLPFAQFSWDWL